MSKTDEASKADASGPTQGVIVRLEQPEALALFDSYVSMLRARLAAMQAGAIPRARVHAEIVVP